MSSWTVRQRQIIAITFWELRKNFLAGRGLWIYLVALAPVAVVWAHSLFELARGEAVRHSLATDTQVLAGIFQFFYLRFSIFFGCVGIFTYLFRGEVLERSLHYYFLAPVQREVLLVAKFLAGFLTASLFFGTSFVLTFAGIYAHWQSAAVQQFLLESGGLGHLGSYVAAAVLACLGYGAVFLALGLLFRNPMIPAVVVFWWEAANLFLPGWLQRISVIYYLKNLCPVPAPVRGTNPFAVLAAVPEATPAWMAILALLLFSTAVLAFAASRVRRMEISYSTD